MITEFSFFGISRQVGTLLASPVSPGCVLHKTTIGSTNSSTNVASKARRRRFLVNQPWVA